MGGEDKLKTRAVETDPQAIEDEVDSYGLSSNQGKPLTTKRSKNTQEIWLRGTKGSKEGDSLADQQGSFGSIDSEPLSIGEAAINPASLANPLSRAEILVSESRSEDEEPTIVRLRPTAFSDYIGQDAVKNNLYIACMAAKQRGEPVDHVLLHGPPGLGKTSLASIVAKELGVGFKVTSGPVIEKPGDLAAILTSLGPKDVLFIDEIHRLPRVVEEVLYPAMEDFHIDIVIGQGASAKSVRIPLKPFTLVGATTRTGLLTSPLRDRFGLVMRLAFYSVEELMKIIVRSAGLLGVQIEEDAARELGSRSRGTPRIANRLLKRVRDVAQQRTLFPNSSEMPDLRVEVDSLTRGGELTLKRSGSICIDREITCYALSLLDIDPDGLDTMDREILRVIIDKFDGGPVGLDTIAAALGEDRGTVEDVYEPYLLQEGFIARTKRGREATPRAYEQLGLARKVTSQLKLFMLITACMLSLSMLMVASLGMTNLCLATERPELRVVIKGDSLRISVAGNNESLQTCAESGLDLKVKYSAAICDKRRFWFDDCKNQRIYLRTLRFDPLRGEFKVTSDTLEDRLAPEEASYQDLEHAWGATFNIERVPLRFLAREQLGIFDTERPYIEVRVGASCSQGDIKGIAKLAANLTLGLTEIKAFDSGMVRLDIPGDLLRGVREKIN